MVEAGTPPAGCTRQALRGSHPCRVGLVAFAMIFGQIDKIAEPVRTHLSSLVAN